MPSDGQLVLLAPPPLPAVARTLAFAAAPPGRTRVGDLCYSDAKVANRTIGISGGRSLTGPLRDARRFPSTRWQPVPGATRTTMVLEICPLFKEHFLSRRAKP
jgi:hypothetical protein